MFKIYLKLKCPVGSPNYIPTPMGRCKNCNETLVFSNNYIIDNEGNTFCTEDCAIEYHGIKEVEWEEDDND